MHIYQKLLIVVMLFFSLSSMGFSAIEEKSDEWEELQNIRKKCLSEFHVLFLCAGNATRSQVAEGWLQQLGGESVKVLSAGIDPRPVNHKAIKIMEEFGLNIQNPTSKRVTPDMIEWADLVITTCDFSRENCPILPEGTVKIHWTIENYPSKTADEVQVKQQLRAMSDEIQNHSLKLLKEFE